MPSDDVILVEAMCTGMYEIVDKKRKKSVIKKSQNQRSKGYIFLLSRHITEIISCQAKVWT